MLILLISFWLLPPFGPAAVGGPAPPAHKFYVSYGRMAVEGSVAVCRVRYFKDDLENALRAFAGLQGFLLAPDATSDSLFLAYVGGRLELRQNERPLPVTLIGSGEEEDMWWFALQFESSSPIRTLTITNRSLFDLLPDQRNILKVSHFPSEKERTLYFVVGSDTYTLNF